MANILGATSISVGTSSLKNIDGDLVFQDDICIVVDSDSSYIYQLNESDTSTEDTPRIIQPTDHGSSKRWILKTNTHWNSDLNFNKTNNLQIHEIKSVDAEGFKFTLSDGTELGTIDSNGLSINDINVTGGNLDIESINNVNLTEFIKSDGSITFTSQVKGITPISADDLVIREYVDDQIDTLTQTLSTSGLTDYIKFDNAVIFTPTTDYQPSSKKYVDDQNVLFNSKTSLHPLIPSVFRLDDVNLGIDYGSVFSMMQTLDFSNSVDGSCWVSFVFPLTSNEDNDIDLKMYYTISGTDTSSNVRMKIDQWITGIGITPDISTPIDTDVNNFSISVGDEGEIQSQTLSVINASNITDNTVITLKITRESTNVADTYDGTFQMLYVVPYQT
jgi:hypothetical protein